MNSAEALLELSVRASVTDVVLTPGTGIGNLHLRAGFRSIHSEPLPLKALKVISLQLFRLAGMAEEAPDLELQVGSFQYGPARVRITRMLTDGGPVVRLRLQRPALIEQALADFDAGLCGRDVLPFLRLPAGILVVAGPPASGKTCALSHLLARAPARVLLVSEARELSAEVEVLQPAGRSAATLVADLAVPAPALLALDEMDEALKLDLARLEGSERLVLCTLTAPDLAAAFRKLRASGLDPDSLLGLFRVTWGGEEDEVRRPVYRWFPVGRTQAGLCPVCEASRVLEGPCPGCGLPPLRQVVDRVILERMNSPEGYRALDRLETEWV